MPDHKKYNRSFCKKQPEADFVEDNYESDCTNGDDGDDDNNSVKVSTKNIRNINLEKFWAELEDSDDTVCDIILSSLNYKLLHAGHDIVLSSKAFTKGMEEVKSPSLEDYINFLVIEGFMGVNTYNEHGIYVRNKEFLKLFNKDIKTEAKCYKPTVLNVIKLLRTNSILLAGIVLNPDFYAYINKLKESINPDDEPVKYKPASDVISIIGHDDENNMLTLVAKWGSIVNLTWIIRYLRIMLKKSGTFKYQKST